MSYVGKATIGQIKLTSLQQLRTLVPETPADKYAWQIYGKVAVEKRGIYNFCSNSDDGSLVYVKNTLVVNNDGLHGTQWGSGSGGETCVDDDNWMNSTTITTVDEKKQWQHCSWQGQTCSCPEGLVRYGWGDRWSSTKGPGTFQCNDNIFGDPWAGQQKLCQCEIKTTTSTVNTYNTACRWVAANVDGLGVLCTAPLQYRASPEQVRQKCPRACGCKTGQAPVCGNIELGNGNWDVVVIGFQNGGGVYEDLIYKGPDTEEYGPTYKPVRSFYANAPQSTAGTKEQFGRWPPVK